VVTFPWGYFPFAVGVADSMTHQIYQRQALRVLVALASLTDPVPHALQKINGRLPKRALKLVFEWLELHRE